MTFAPTNGSVGLRQGSIGVFAKSGEACGQVNGTEALTIDLGSKRASTAVLDLELIQDAVVDALVVTDDGDVPLTLASGRSAGTIDGAVSCQTAASSGPNSGPSDNCRWVIDQDGIKSIKLSVRKGSFSLEGGADGTAAKTAGEEPTGGYPVSKSYFVLEDLFECQTGAVTVNGSTTTPTATIRNATTSAGTCESFSYDLTTAGGEVNFTKPWSDQSKVLQFMMDLSWDILPGEDAGLPTVFFGFHDKDLVQSTTPRLLKWCDNPVYTAGLVTGLTTTPTAAMDFETNETRFPGTQYACAADPRQLKDANGKPVKWIMSVYVHGDAYARR